MTAHKARSGLWAVTYLTPLGRRVERMTRAEVRGKTPPPEFHAHAQQLIKQSYTLALPSHERKGWDELLAEVEAKNPHIRAETLRSFRAAIKVMKDVMPDVASPVDISDDRVTRFDRLARVKADGTVRAAATVSYYHRALSAFTNHLVPEAMPRNPWKLVTVKVKKVKKDAPAESQVSRFFAYIKTRYPDWHALHALVELKAMSASRTADLCQIRTQDLKDGRLTFTGDIVKTGQERTLPLPPDLYARLKELAGPTYLWDGAFWQSIRRFRKQSNGLPPNFRWKTVYTVVNNVFKEFNEAHPGQPKLTPHALRRRAITLTVVGLGGNVDAAANAIGVHPQTAKTHYLDHKMAFDADADLRKVMDALRPK